MTRTCTAEGCDRPTVAKGLCTKHYQRMKNNGTLEVSRKPPVNCFAAGCDRTANGRLLCDMHASRLRERGVIDDQRTPILRWRDLVDPVPEGCWLWKGHLSPPSTKRTDDGGYGAFWYDGRNGLAHRWTYEWFYGPIPEGHEVDHLCNVRACVNPTHLEAVTPKENSRRREERAAH